MREAEQQQRPPTPKDAGSVNRHTQVLQTKAEEQQKEEDKLALEESKHRASLQRQLWKTRFCMFHLQGVCQMGRTCAFAHNLHELQGAPDLRNTKLCKNNMRCQVPGCAFAHSEEELRSTDPFYKKKMCMWHKQGRCRNGSQCRFAHGNDELRQRGSCSSSGPRPSRRASTVVNELADVASPPPLPYHDDASNSASATGRQHAEQARASGCLASQKVADNQGQRPVLKPMFVGNELADVAPPPPVPYHGDGSNSASSTSFQHAEQARASGCLASQTVAAIQSQRPMFEPMFVPPVRKAVPPVPAPPGDCLQQLDQAEQLQRASARLQQILEASRNSMQAEHESRALQEQINQLHRLFSAAAMIASACSAPAVPGTLALHATIESLTSQVSNLAMQLSRIERNLQMRQAVVAFGDPSFGGLSSTLMAQASNLLRESAVIERLMDSVPYDNMAMGLFGNTSSPSPQFPGTRPSSFRSS